MADNPRWFSPPGYGLTDFEDVFTPRQLVALTEFSDLVVDLRKRVISDGGSTEYADAIATYLGLAVSRYADLSNALCSWNHTNENIRALFSRQAVPMTWDFVEANVFGSIGLDGPIESICNSLHLGIGPAGTAVQMSASAANFEGTIISTDPPYYDNIGYSDLSDFFYVWLRRSLRQVHPELLATLLVPKADELVANLIDTRERVEQKNSLKMDSVKFSIEPGIQPPANSRLRFTTLSSNLNQMRQARLQPVGKLSWKA